MTLNQTLDRRAELRALLDGLGPGELREMGVQALRQWRQERPNENQLSMHGVLGRLLVPIIAARQQRPIAIHDLHECFLPGEGSLSQPWMSPIVEFVLWLVRAGVVWPMSGETNQLSITLYVTADGLRFLESDEDHPLLPNFVERIAGRCPGLADEVTLLLRDGHTCLSRMLLRPAIVMMGVAYELAVEHVAQALAVRTLLPAEVLDWSASRRITAVRGVIGTVFPERRGPAAEPYYAALAAYDFADELRRRRNDASHTTPRYGFDDRAEIEEFFTSAGRFLPALWSVGVAP